MKILVSACLLGHKVRYDGSDKDQRNGVMIFDENDIEAAVTYADCLST